MDIRIKRIAKKNDYTIGKMYISTAAIHKKVWASDHFATV